MMEKDNKRRQIKTLTLVSATLISLSKAETLCNGFYIGTSEKEFNVMKNGIFTEEWDPNSRKSQRNVIRRDSEYFYTKFLEPDSGKINVKKCSFIFF